MGVSRRECCKVVISETERSGVEWWIVVWLGSLIYNYRLSAACCLFALNAEALAPDFNNCKEICCSGTVQSSRINQRRNETYPRNTLTLISSHIFSLFFKLF